MITTFKLLKEGLFEWLKRIKDEVFAPAHLPSDPTIYRTMNPPQPLLQEALAPMANTIFGFPADTVNAFDKAYTASLAPPLQELMAMSQANNPDGTNPRTEHAGELALQGYTIDVPIMAWGWDPYMIMFQRGIDGLTTVPDGLNQTQIKVSTDITDYPPYPAPPLDPNAQYIDKPIGGVAYNGAAWFPTPLTVQAKLPAGTILTYQGHTFTLHVTTQQTFGSTQLIYVWLQISD